MDVVPTQVVAGFAVACLVGACLPAQPTPTSTPEPRAAATQGDYPAGAASNPPIVDVATMSVAEARSNLRDALQASCQTCLGLSHDCHLSALLTLSPVGNGVLEKIERPPVERSDLVCIGEQLNGILKSRIDARARVRAEFRSEPERDCISLRRAEVARCELADLMCQMRAVRAPIKDARTLSRWHESESCDYAFTLLE